MPKNKREIERLTISEFTAYHRQFSDSQYIRCVVCNDQNGEDLLSDLEAMEKKLEEAVTALEEIKSEYEGETLTYEPQHRHLHVRQKDLNWINEVIKSIKEN